jgi:hypothetical protein
VYRRPRRPKAEPATSGTAQSKLWKVLAAGQSVAQTAKANQSGTRRGLYQVCPYNEIRVLLIVSLERL